jgi:hypothetical protein
MPPKTKAIGSTQCDSAVFANQKAAAIDGDEAELATFAAD